MASDAENVPKLSPSSSESESESEGKAAPEEWLVNARGKRSTAGNQLHILLQQEDLDDELELLFAEDDEDVGFSDVEADQSDELMDSSTDNEDQGPTAGEDFEGEKELQRVAKLEQAKKKKKHGGMPQVLRKKVSIDSNPTPLPRKRVERASWLPAASDAPVRASSRGTTRQSKQELQMQMMDREIKRLKQLANMKKAAAAKAAKAKPPLTQEDRLKEAARVEKANAMSLSRWERAEEEREEQQRLRLANLHDRHMEGPVLTFWSGMATYVGGKLQKLGRIEIEAREKPAAKKRKTGEIADGLSPVQKQADVDLALRPSVQKDETRESNLSGQAEESAATSKADSTTRAASEVGTLLPKILPAQPPPQPASSCLAPPAGLPLLAPPHPFLAPPCFNGSSPLPNFGFHQPHLQQHQRRQFPSPLYQPHIMIPPSIAPPAPACPPATERCLRSSLIFSNFAEAAIKSRETQLNILFPFARNCSARFTKVPRARASNKANLCAITGYPARYRDPKTGLHYCNSYAYQEIQKLQRGEIWWSDLVGVYVGKGAAGAASGVPDRFKGVEEKKDSIG